MFLSYSSWSTWSPLEGQKVKWHPGQFMNHRFESHPRQEILWLFLSEGGQLSNLHSTRPIWGGLTRMDGGHVVVAVELTKHFSISGWGFAALPVLWLHNPRLLQCSCGIPCCWTNHHHLLQQQQPLQQEQQRSHLQWPWNSSAHFCHQHSSDECQGKGERRCLRPLLPKLQRLWEKSIRSPKVT